ncbi:MAG: hypothetical protein PHI41_08790 [Erysipelotrichaceae bacterium]|nr:hypothetical protein [Erysipelotrichaceae bacterium]MDD3808812.1 hypothetical protein [Erysipelotrichaceae bacterium]
MKIRIGLTSLFNIIIILVLITLTFNSYIQTKASQTLIDQNLAHNLTYLEARSIINRFINDSREIPLTNLQDQYDFQMEANVITFQEVIDYGQTVTLVYDYNAKQIISLQVQNNSDYQLDDLAPVYTGE